MYNVHPYFSLKNLGKKCTLYMAKYGSRTLGFLIFKTMIMVQLRELNKVKCMSHNISVISKSGSETKLLDNGIRLHFFAAFSCSHPSQYSHMSETFEEL